MSIKSQGGKPQFCKLAVGLICIITAPVEALGVRGASLAGLDFGSGEEHAEHTPWPEWVTVQLKAFGSSSSAEEKFSTVV